MSRIFFTADQHLGHRQIIEYCGRPFSSVDEMNEEMVRRHNAVVGPDDHVIHLGDFALDERLVPVFLPRLNGKHTLICGNHDRCHPRHRKHEKARRFYKGFDDVALFTWAVFPGLGSVWLCHFPPSGDSLESERYPEYRPHGVKPYDWLLHGHVHEAWKRQGKMINVGVDQWDYAPVSVEQLAAFVQEEGR